jgi:hypothetical protein
VLYIPFLRDLFHFGMLHANDMALCLGAAAACIVWFELVKYLSGRKSSNVQN